MASKKNKENHIIIGEVSSDSDPSLFYKIGVDKQLSEKFNHVHFTCSCTAFKFSGKGGIERHCKHTAEFKQIAIRDNPRGYPSFNTEKGLQSLSEIIGWTIYSSGTGNWILKEKLNSIKIIQIIETILTKITCPFIMCGHVMKGQFSSQEFQTCEKCTKRFMPQ